MLYNNGCCRDDSFPSTTIPNPVERKLVIEWLSHESQGWQGSGSTRNSHLYQTLLIGDSGQKSLDPNNQFTSFVLFLHPSVEIRILPLLSKGFLEINPFTLLESKPSPFCPLKAHYQIKRPRLFPGHLVQTTLEAQKKSGRLMYCNKLNLGRVYVQIYYCNSKLIFKLLVNRLFQKGKPCILASIV